MKDDIPPHIIQYTGDNKSRPGRRIREAMEKAFQPEPAEEFIYKTP